MSTDTLQRRYGVRERRRWPFVGVCAALLVAAVAWVAWVGVAQADPPLSYQLRSYDVVSSHRTDVSIELHRRDGDAVECELYAQSLDYGIVGERLVEVPAGDPGGIVIDTSVATEREAVTGVLRTCRVV